MSTTMNDHHVEIRCVEESYSLAPSSVTGSNYGLLSSHHHNQGRERVVTKCRERMKLLGAFAIVILVIGGSAAFIGAHYQSTQVFHSENSDISGESRHLPPMASTSASNKKDDSPNVFVLQSRKDSGSSIIPMQQLSPPISTNDQNQSIKQPIATIEKSEQGENEGETLGDDGDGPFNENATCLNHIKKPPKKEISTKEKHAGFNNPIGLLHEMLECPTFTDLICTKAGTKIHLGFKTELHVRSSNQTFFGYGVSKKKSRKYAATHAAETIYNKTGQFDEEETKITKILAHSHCVFIEKPKQLTE